MTFFKKKEDELGVRLNDVQKEAVLHKKEPLLLLASPGSGKTTTMIMRIGYLIEEMKVHPERLLAVTFSKASAADMTERFDRFFPNSVNGKPKFSTIHSLCFGVVREWMRNKGQDYIMNEGNVQNYRMRKQSILNEIYKKHTGEWITDDMKDELNTHISFIKNRMLKDEEISKVAPDFQQLLPIFQDYETYKANHTPRLLDFDDMLTLANQAFEEDGDLLLRYQNMYDHILTDESQDTSIVQHEIVKKLAGKHLNLFVVGDEDQSVYFFRGASVEKLLDFEKTYPTAKILFMEQNYRSNGKIVEVSNRFIKRNKKRFDKNMFTENKTGNDIVMKHALTYTDQLEHIVKSVEESSDMNEVAVLFRNTNSAVPLIHLLDKKGIKFYQKDETNSFFSHVILKDVRNYFRLSYRDTVQHASLLADIMPRFSGYIKKADVIKTKNNSPDMNLWDALLQTEGFGPHQKSAVERAKRIIPKLKNMTPAKALEILYSDLKYEDVLKNYADFTGRNLDALHQVFETLERMAIGVKTIPEFFQNLDRLEEVVSESRFNRGQDAVTLSTFHSSKGLEFNKVLMMDLQSNIVPSPQDMRNLKEGDNEAVEEAARLFYVGMTRARQDLTLIHYGRNKDASMFYKDVEKLLKGKADTAAKKKTTPKKADKLYFTPIDYRKDMLVTHRQFGEGVIKELDGSTITVAFNDRIRSLSREHCVANGTLQEVHKKANVV